MNATAERTVMGRKTAPPPQPEPEPEGERVTIINLKGSDAERDFLRSFSRLSGIPASTVARRGMAMFVREWSAKNGGPNPPDEWAGKA